MNLKEKEKDNHISKNSKNLINIINCIKSAIKI